MNDAKQETNRNTITYALQGSKVPLANVYEAATASAAGRIVLETIVGKRLNMERLFSAKRRAKLATGLGGRQRVKARKESRRGRGPLSRAERRLLAVQPTPSSETP